MVTDASPRRIARFGVFDLDARTGELLKRGVRVHLQEQPLQVLAMLVERAGDLVTREELRERLYSRSVFVSFDQALNNAVAKIRAVLGDRAESPHFIETLERHGYRFIASVQWVSPADLCPASAAGTKPSKCTVVARLTAEDRTIALTEGAHVIGRDPEAEVWIDSPVVSRHHARLIVGNGLVTVEDLGSRNGTFVNREPVTRISVLAHGDELRLGTIAFVVHLSTGRTPTRAVDIRK